MKKILFILMVILCSSCVSTYTTYTTSIGCVTAYTANGEILRKWDNIKLTESTNGSVTTNSYKTFGYNFYDQENGNYVIINNAVPCIVEYKVEEKNISNDTFSYVDFNEQVIKKDELMSIYINLLEEELSTKAYLKTLNVDSDEYKNTKTKLKTIKRKRKDVDYIIFRDYGEVIN